MLVLARLRDESVMIGDNVKVTIVDIRGDKVRIGFEAPKSMPIHRQEVYDADKREKARKAGLAPAPAAGAEPQAPVEPVLSDLDWWEGEADNFPKVCFAAGVWQVSVAPHAKTRGTSKTFATALFNCRRAASAV